MQMTSAQERRLVAGIHALRHLPPGTFLPQLSMKIEQKLLNELLQLSDEIDIISWIHKNAEREVALIALGIALRQIGTICQSLLETSPQVNLSEHEQQLYGGLLNLSGERLYNSLWK